MSKQSMFFVDPTFTGRDVKDILECIIQHLVRIGFDGDDVVRGVHNGIREYHECKIRSIAEIYQFKEDAKDSPRNGDVTQSVR